MQNSHGSLCSIATFFGHVHGCVYRKVDSTPHDTQRGEVPLVLVTVVAVVAAVVVVVEVVEVESALSLV